MALGFYFNSEQVSDTLQYRYVIHAENGLIGFFVVPNIDNTYHAAIRV